MLSAARKLALALALALGGCADEPVPLSRAAIEDLSRQFGDAEGDTWSGIYRMAPRNIACDCKKLEPGAIGAGLDPNVVPCETLVQLLIGSGSNAALGMSSQRVSLLQSDGYLSMLVETSALGATQLTGPIDADDDAEVGAVLAFEALGAGDRVLSRYSVSMFLDDQGKRAFEGRARVRAISSVPDAEANCRIEADLVGEEAVDGTSG